MRRRWPGLGIAGLIMVLPPVVWVVLARGPQAAQVIRTVPVGVNVLPIAVDERTGRVFVVDRSDNTVRVLDSRTGRIVRVVPALGAASYLDHSLVVAPRSNRAFAIGSGGIAVLDARSGALLRTISLPGVPSYLAITTAPERLIVALSTPPGLSVLDAHTGTILRTTPLRLVPGPPLIDAQDHRIIVAGFGDLGLAYSTLSIFNAMTGQLLHTSTRSPLSAMAVDGSHRHVLILSRTRSGLQLDTLDAVSGRLVHRTPIGGQYGSLTVAESPGRIFVNVSGGALRLFDTATGRPVGTVAAPPGSDPLIDPVDDHAFVTSTHGVLTMLDARTGAALRTTDIGPGIGEIALVTPLHLLVLTYTGVADPRQTTTRPGWAAIVDARTGALLQRSQVGVDPFAVIVDGRAGRAFVLNGGGSVRAADPWGWLPAGLRRRLPFLPAPPVAVGEPGSVTVLALRRP